MAPAAPAHGRPKPETPKRPSKRRDNCLLEQGKIIECNLLVGLVEYLRGGHEKLIVVTLPRTLATALRSNPVVKTKHHDF